MLEAMILATGMDPIMLGGLLGMLIWAGIGPKS